MGLRRAGRALAGWLEKQRLERASNPGRRYARERGWASCSRRFWFSASVPVACTLTPCPCHFGDDQCQARDGKGSGRQQANRQKLGRLGRLGRLLWLFGALHKHRVEVPFK